MKSEGRTALKIGLASVTLSSMLLFGIATPTFAAATLDKAQFLQLFLQMEGVQPDPTGNSSYTDVPKSSSTWGYVHKAVELGIAKPDSKTRFGAADPLLTAFATQAVTSYYKMALGGETPSQWAYRQGLATDSSSTWTTVQTQQFLDGLKSLVAAHQSLPGSWMLTPAQVTEFVNALESLDSAPYSQTGSQMSDKMTYTLTSAGKKNSQIVNALQQLADQSVNEFDAQRNVASVGDTTVFVDNTTLTTHDPTSGANMSQNITQVAFGNTVYTNSGNDSQWSSRTATVNNAFEFIPVFGSGSFTNITIEQGNGRDVFTGNLTATAQNTFFQSYLKGLASAHAGGNASLVQTMEKDMTSTVKIDVSTMSGQPVVTEEDLQASIKLTPSTFAQMSGDSSASASIAKVLSSVVISLSSKAQIAFNTVTPPLPAGLSIPGWPSTSAVENDSTTVNNSASAVKNAM